MNMEYEHEHGIMTSTLFANHCKRSNNQAALKAKNDEIGFFDVFLNKYADHFKYLYFIISEYLRFNRI